MIENVIDALLTAVGIVVVAQVCLALTNWIDAREKKKQLSVCAECGEKVDPEKALPKYDIKYGDFYEARICEECGKKEMIAEMEANRKQWNGQLEKLKYEKGQSKRMIMRGKENEE